MIAAIVPAAGKSERMGRCKLTLRIGGRTVIERVVRALCDGGVDRIVVVTDSDEIHVLAMSVGADALLLTDPTGSMRETVGFGLSWIEAHLNSRPAAWLLMPGDFPLVPPHVVRALREHFSREPTNSIIVPVHAGLRGHPILIPWQHVADIRAMPREWGIDDYVRSVRAVEVAVADPGILRDVDTPDDLRHIRDAQE